MSELTVTCVFNLSSETVRVAAASLGLESPETGTEIYQLAWSRLAEVFPLALFHHLARGYRGRASLFIRQRGH